MSKNLTRKGLAFGALVALGSSVIAGAPAFASDLVTVLSSGTSLNSVVGYSNELKLTTTLAPALAANETTLNYRISNPSGATLEIGLGRSGTSSGAIVIADNGTAYSNFYKHNESTASNTDADSSQSGVQTTLTDFVVQPKASTGYVGEADDNNFITIAVKDADVNASVTVTAWLDSSANASNNQDSTEVSAAPVTLNFYDQANVTATTTIVSPVTGATNVQAEISTTPELNGQQLGADFIDASFTSQGNANAVLAKNTSSDAAASPTMGTTTYNGTTKVWTSTAYLKYSKATDAFAGTDGTLTGIADLTDNDGAGSGTTAAKFTGNGTSKLVTMTLFPHGLGASNAGSFAVTVAGVTTSTQTSAVAATAAALTIVDANQITFTGPSAVATVSAENATAGSASFWSVGANSGLVVASGVYSATPYIGTTKLGAVGSSTNSAITATDTKATVTGSVNVVGSKNETATTATTVAVRKGTTSVETKAVVYYTDADTGLATVAPAGIPVTGYISGTNVATAQINAAGAGVTSKTVYTDANGSVTFTVSTTSAADLDTVTLEIRPQSIASGDAAAAKFTFNWAAASYTIWDLASNATQPGSNASSYRSITTGGSYTYDFAVLDQWGQAADAATYRLQVVNSGRTVSSATHTLASGKVSVPVADGAQGAGSTITSTVNLQKLVSGTWTTQATESWDGTGFGTVVINVLDAQTDAITLDASGAQLYEQDNTANVNASFSSAIAADAVVAQDRRTSAASQPTYTNALVIHGRVSNKLTGAARGGQKVTVSGPSTLLLSAGSVDAFGTITVVTSDEGDFTIKAYSNTVQEDSVLTFTTTSGASKTQKVTISPVAGTSGTKLTVSAPATAKSGRTLVIVGTLTDKYGNGVDTEQATANAAGATTLDAGDARLTVTYEGPGLVTQTIPVETGANGTFTIRVLLGTDDAGVAKVSAVYGAANGTISSTDTGANIDLKASASTLVGVSATVSAGKKLASVNVKNAAGLTVKVVSGTKVATKVATSDSFKISLTKLTAGKKTVKVYVNDVLVSSKSVTVKK
jgi:hypothetical protein